MNEEKVLFDPARMATIESEGAGEYAYVHPDLDEFYAEAEDGEDVRLDDAKLKAAGWTSDYVSFDDAPEELAARYEEGEATPIGEWNPEAPAGDGWILVAKYDTESGPFAMFVRRILQ